MQYISTEKAKETSVRMTSRGLMFEHQIPGPSTSSQDMGLGLGIPRRRRNPNSRKAGGICLGFGGEGMSTYTTRVPYYLNHIASLKHCFMCNIFLQKKRRKPLCA